MLGQLIGAENYDAGHVTLSNDGGGIAALGVVGTANKALGCTGIPEADGDYYTVDYWAHEMGHDWHMNHTFGGDLYNCAGGNRNDPTAVEPGSASSIMGYAGICQQDNLQTHSDPYFSQRSYEEAQTFMSAHHANVNEVQTVAARALRRRRRNPGRHVRATPRQTNGFEPERSSSFRVEIGGTKSALIGKGGADYTDAGIQAAINGIAGFAGTVAVSRHRRRASPSPTRAASANHDVPNLSITNLSCGGCYAGGRREETRRATRLVRVALRREPRVTGDHVRPRLHGRGDRGRRCTTCCPLAATATVAGFGGSGVARQHRVPGDVRRHARLRRVRAARTSQRCGSRS